jgi:phosphoadenosine phosphosulfate reductase
MLKENTLFGTRDKVAEAIQRLKSFEPEDGYYVAFSGGKDSQCIYHLCEMAGVKFDAHYSVTSVDPPELVRFIKDHYPNVKRDIPHDKDGKPITMWNLIPKKKIPPSRIARYCCAELKEKNSNGRITVTGVRWAESVRRKLLHGVANVITKDEQEIRDALERSGTAKLNDRGSIIMNDDNDENRRTVEQCYRTRTTLVNPIVDWQEDDVWEFLNDVAKVPHCELYDQGYTRLGCIGCPMNVRLERDFDRYPKYREAWLRAFGRMINERKKAGLETRTAEWETPESTLKWYIYHAKN